MIGEAEKRAIKRAIEIARDKPVPLDAVMGNAFAIQGDLLSLADRKPGPVLLRSEQVLIPFGYRATVAFEQQPMGLCMHMAVSSLEPGTLPNLPALTVIASEFGVALPLEEGRLWIEEFEPGHHAINIVLPAP